MICHYFQEPLFFFYVPELPVLLYYAHVPAILISLVLGLFVLLSDRKTVLNRVLFGLCMSFAAWSLSTLILWTNVHSDVLLFTWSFLGPAAAFISVFSIYFTYVFLERRDVNLALKAIFLVLLGPIIVLAPTALTLSGFNLVNSMEA